MSSNNPLPDFIEVANIKDLFWNNNSDLYPTCVPTGYHRIDKTRPVFYSPYVGTCVLKGEFNHCIYNGTYYFLTKLEVLDIQTKTYKYQLDYDVMINFMNTSVDVKGTLIRTNREDILEKCLQTTKPVLADPIDSFVCSYDKTKSNTWQEKLTVKGLDNVQGFKWRFPIKIAPREQYNTFIHNVENNAIAKGTANKEWLCNRKEFNIHSHHDPLIILETLDYVLKPDIWRYNLVLKIEELLKDREKLVIVKQSTPTDHFNIGGYVLGKKDSTVGSNIASDVTLSEIDLSNLSFITPIDNRTKKKLQPNKVVTYDILPHSNNADVYLTTYGLMVLLRKPYLPIANEKSNTGCIAPITGTDNYLETNTWKGIENPQKITTKSDEVGFLWYLDKNNLALLKGKLGTLKGTRANVRPSVYEDEYSRWGFFNTEYKNLAPIGFLIYQLRRQVAEWDGIVYKGITTNQLQFRVGLRYSTCLRNYNDDTTREWWANADEEMWRLWGSRLFARINLDLDQFNWLSIAPSYSGLNYKYYWENYWGYQKFFPHAGSRELWYPSRINRMNIKWNGKEIDNPYAYADPNTRLPAWLEARDKKLDDISIYSAVSTHPIKKGDIVVSSYEHNWVTPKGWWFRYYLPYDITSAEWGLWAANARSSHSQLIQILEEKAKEKNDDESRTQALEQGLGITAVVIGTVLAPFTGGLSLIPSATALATMHITEGNVRNKAELAYMINTEPHSSNKPVRYLLNRVIFYLYRGEYRIGIISRHHEQHLRVSDDKDNLVKEVNGTVQQPIDITVIRPITDKLDFSDGSPLSEVDKNNILKYAYGVSLSEINDVKEVDQDIIEDDINPSSDEVWIDRERVTYYGLKDLEVGSYTFDLVGTDWYLLVHNGTFNLIPKDTKVFIPIQVDDNAIEVKTDKPIPIGGKINQKAILNYYGQEFILNTKFPFNTKLKYESRPLNIGSQFADPDVEYKWLLVDHENDKIDVIVTIPKKESRTFEKVDSSQVLMMKERLLQLATNYEQDKYAAELMISDKRLAMARQREDLDSQWWSALFGAAAKPIGGAVLGGIKGGFGGGALGAAAGLSAAKGDITTLIRYPTLMKRVNEDERNALLANSQQLYQRKQNYEHDFRYQTFKLNKIAGSYQKSGVSNREVQEKYNEAHKVGDVFVKVWIPSKQQQKVVDHIYNTFGCECVSDEFEKDPLTIRSNMDPGIYKFSRIQSGGINANITDTTLREILKAILENGVKFEECKFSIEPLEPRKVPTLTIITPSPHPEIDPTKIVEWPKELWDIYKQQKGDDVVINTIKGLPHYGLTDDEWNKYKDKIRTATDRTLFEDVDKIISNRDGGTTVIIGELPKQPDDVQGALDALKIKASQLITKNAQLKRENSDLVAKRAELETKNAELTNKATELQSKATELEIKKTELEVAKADLENRNQDLQNKKTELENKNRELEDMKSELEDDKQQLESAKATLEAKKTELEARLRQCEEDKGLRPENCDAEVAAAREAIQKQLDETTAMLKKNRAALRTKNEALAKANTEKDKIQQELNKVKSDLSTAQDSVTRVTGEKADIERQLSECRATIETYTQDIESLNQQKADLTEQLRQCKIDLENVRQSKDTCDRVNSDEIKKLRSKIKELEGDIALKQVEIDAAKKGLDATVIRAETLSKEYKNLEEKLKQQTNVSNLYKQEADNFKRQKENLETQKADIERQLRECLDAKTKVQRELDDLKKTVKSPAQLQDECNLMKVVLNDPFDIDVKQREGGLSRFIDLIVIIADGIKWMRRAGIDQRLMNNQKMRPIIQRLDEFENIEIVDKIEDVTRDPHWDKFLKVINQTNLNTHNDADVQRIYDRMRQISALQIPYIIHGVKASLDELNYITFKTKEELKEQIKTDEDLQYFFKHIYPGNAIKVYKEIFGSPEAAIVKKRFTFETQCTADQGESAITTLDRFNKVAKETIEGIPIVQPGTAPIPPGLPTFMGIPLTREKRFFIQPFNWFRDAKNPKGVAAFKVGKDASGNPLSGVEAYNYPYTIKDRSDESQQNRNAIWVQYFTQWGSSNSNYYMIKETGDVARVRDAALHLWRNKSKCLIADSAIQEFSNPNAHFSISITMRGFQQHGTYQKNELPIGGKGALLKGLGNYTKDFMILWMILNACRYTAKKWRTSGVESGGYKVTEVTGQWMSEWPTTTFEWGMAAHQTSTNMEVSFIVPTEYVDDLKTQLDTRIGTGNMTNRHGSIYRLLSWMYAVVSQPDQAEDLIRMMFDPSTPFGKFLDFKVRV